MFEASVGGGIPIIRALNSSLTADRIDEVIGILNGTTNYMMTKMFFEGADYAEVLKEAQDKGYAERNPEADVEGHDACRKIAILTSLISGQHVDFEKIHTEGITKITTEDMKYAKKLNMAIKLLASSKRVGDTFSVLVAPMLLSEEHPLCNVNDVFNAVFVRGNMLGDAMFYGSGAGKTSDSKCRCCRRGRCGKASSQKCCDKMGCRRAGADPECRGRASFLCKGSGQIRSSEGTDQRSIWFC